MPLSTSLAAFTSTPVTVSDLKDEQGNTTSSSFTQKFAYSRASPAVRWTSVRHMTPQLQPNLILSLLRFLRSPIRRIPANSSIPFPPATTKRRTKMNKVALIRAKDWRERVKLLTDKILTLKPNQFVAEHSRRSPRSDDSHRLLLRREIRRRRELPTSSRGFRVAQPPPLALSQRAHGSGHSRRSGPVESRISRGGDFR